MGPQSMVGKIWVKVEEGRMVEGAGPRYVAGGSFTPAAVVVSRWSEAWRQSPGVSGSYQLRPRVGSYRGRGWGRYRRG